MSSDKSSIVSQQNLTGANRENHSTYEFEDFRLDAAHLMLYRGSRALPLKPKVIETLVALVERGGEVVGKLDLMQRLWPDSFVEESNLTQNIYLLRKTLGDTRAGRPYIETFARRGYCFNGGAKSSNDTALLIATRTRTQTIVEEETTEVSTPTARRFLPAAALATAACLLLSSAVYFAYRYNRGAVPAFQHFKLTRRSESGQVTGATVSRDGKFIAYTDKKNAVWLKNTSTDSTVKIVAESDLMETGVSTISPDNNYIYIGRTQKDKKTEIFKIPLFGSGAQQKVTDNIQSNLSLSPNGEQLSFVRNNVATGEFALMVINTDGTGERKLATVENEGTWFGLWGQSTAWSPDGDRIACTGGVTDEGRSIANIKIFSVADGKELSMIKPSSDGYGIEAVAWAPNGEDLFVIGGDSNSPSQIYQYTIATGSWRRITNDLSEYVGLAITSDGKTVITTQFDAPGNLWTLPVGADASQARQLTFGRNTINDATGLSWTPDGKVVYATNAGGRWEIWVINADGTDQKQLTVNCAGNDSCGQPVVSPDGNYIVFQAKLNGARNVWRMDIDGANVTRLTNDGGFAPSFTPDGRFVIYVRFTAPKTTLWRVPIRGGDAERFTSFSAGNSAISPDGSMIAFDYFDEGAKQPYQTCVAGTEAKVPEKCFGISRSFPRWAADGKAFYYLDHGYAGIWKQPLDGERSLFLEFPGEHTTNFDLSRDGKTVVVSRDKPTQDIVAIVNAP